MTANTRIPSLSALRDVPAGVLSRGRWDVIVPEETTNLVPNPSFEVNTNGWNGAVGMTIQRDTSAAAFGAACLLISVNSSATTMSTGIPVNGITAGRQYTFSFWYRKTCDADMRGRVILDFRNNASTTISIVSIDLPPGPISEWTRFVLTATAPVGATNVVATPISLAGQPTGRVFSMRIDGVQFEEKSYATTYCDGEQDGCTWLGGVHASLSFRKITKKGGRIVNLSSFKFQVAAAVGLGAAAVQPIAMPYAQIGGALYQRTIAPPRTFQIAGGWDCESDIDLHRSRQDMMDAILASGASDEELTRLIFTPASSSCDVETMHTPNQKSAVIDAAYSGGLEGAWTNDVGIERATIAFTTFLPFMAIGSSPFDTVVQVVTATDQLNDINAGVRNMLTGNYVSTTGVTGVVRAAAVGQNGELYIAGAGVWRLDGSTWTSLGTFNGQVNALAVDADGGLWAGGTFTTINGGGISALAKWNGSTWAASGATFSPADVRSVVFDSRGRMWVGGAFTTVNGGASVYVTVLDGTWQAVFNPLISVASGGVNAIAQVKANVMYVGGRFDLNAGAGVQPYNLARIITDANSNNTAWRVNTQNFNASVDAIAVAPTGETYIGGQFTSPTTYLATQTPDLTPTSGGTPDQPNFQPLAGAGLSARVRGLAFRPDGGLIVAGDFSSIGGYSQSGFGEWRGGVWVHPDFEIIGNGGYVFAESNAMQVWGGDFFYSRIARVQEVVNTSKAPVYVDVTVAATSAWMRNVQTWPDRARVMINPPAGGVYTSLRLRTGETPTLIASSRDLRIALVSGSDLTRMKLLPGVNRISVFTSQSTTTITFRWRNQFRSLDSVH